MKPYKIIKSKLPIPKKKLIGLLRPKKVPLWFTTKVHTPPKRDVYLPDQGV